MSTMDPAPATLDEAAPERTETHRAEPERVFNTSILISAIRCTLTYVILPFVAPLIGVAGGVGPALGIALSAVAIPANVFSIRRFWAADHRWKKPVTAMHLAVIVLLTILAVMDIRELAG